jgi:hypothetical protein
MRAAHAATSTATTNVRQKGTVTDGEGPVS